METINQKRDYDQNPIIIKDYNSLFHAIIMLSFMPLMILTYIYNPGGTSEESLFRNIFIIIPIAMYPYIHTYFKAKGKRKIILGGSSIKFKHEKDVIEEIYISEITDVKKTFFDIYHKSQKLDSLKEFGLYVGVPLMMYIANLYWLIFIFPLFWIYTLLIKIIFHKLKYSQFSYRLFDAVIVYKDENFINILPTTEEEYKEIKQYFMNQGLGDIQNKKIYFEIEHMYEKINLEGK
jgi:hypothetical protein